MEQIQGAIRGYRWWRMDTESHRLLSPWRGDYRWTREWSFADCLGKRRLVGWSHDPKHGSGNVPVRSCRCGFYGLWDLPQAGVTAWPIDPQYSAGPMVLVFGVVEGAGHVIVHERGWRASSARPAALYAPQGAKFEGAARRIANYHHIQLCPDMAALIGEWGPDPDVRAWLLRDEEVA